MRRRSACDIKRCLSFLCFATCAVGKSCSRSYDVGRRTALPVPVPHSASARRRCCTGASMAGVALNVGLSDRLVRSGSVRSSGLSCSVGIYRRTEATFGRSNSNEYGINDRDRRWPCHRDESFAVSSSDANDALNSGSDLPCVEDKHFRRGMLPVKRRHSLRFGKWYVTCRLSSVRLEPAIAPCLPSALD